MVRPLVITSQEHTLTAMIECTQVGQEVDVLRGLRTMVRLQ